MKFNEVMAYYDYKIVKIINALMMTRETISRWRKNDSIPFKAQCMLEVISHGKLKADLAQYDIEQKERHKKDD